MGKSRYLITEACEITGIEKEFLIHCLHAHWILPANPTGLELDEEDLARLQLIHELRRDLGVNDEAIPVILGLLDQLYALRSALARRGGRQAA